MGCESGCGGCPLAGRCRSGGSKIPEINNFQKTTKVEFGSEMEFNYVPEALGLWKTAKASDTANSHEPSLAEMSRCPHGFSDGSCPHTGCKNHKGESVVYESGVKEHGEY
jgi:hypothetical protein